MYKNIAKQEKLLLKNLVDYQPGQVVSKTLVQNELMSMTLFAFEKGEEISTHAAGGDAMVTVLEGTGRFTVGGVPHIVKRTNLAEVIFEIRREKNPCRKSFQAIRIEVNHELDVLETALTDGFDVLKKGGRMSVITFHSLEDRIVKNRFREFCTGCTCPPEFPVCVCGRKPMGRLIDKKPITASAEELDRNPRSRSAKLRVIEKIRTTPFED